MADSLLFMSRIFSLRSFYQTGSMSETDTEKCFSILGFCRIKNVEQKKMIPKTFRKPLRS